jgi:hypothetical protein
MRKLRRRRNTLSRAARPVWGARRKSASLYECVALRWSVLDPAMRRQRMHCCITSVCSSADCYSSSSSCSSVLAEASMRRFQLRRSGTA